MFSSARLVVLRRVFRMPLRSACDLESRSIMPFSMNLSWMFAVVQECCKWMFIVMQSSMVLITKMTSQSSLSSQHNLTSSWKEICETWNYSCLRLCFLWPSFLHYFWTTYYSNWITTIHYQNGFLLYLTDLLTVISLWANTSTLREHVKVTPHRGDDSQWRSWL